MISLFSKILFIAFLIFAGSVAYEYRAQTVPYIESIKATFSKPCSTPTLYTLGTIDPRFNISKDEILVELSKASKLWNGVYGKDLLVYSASSSKAIPISLIYDRRQEAVSLDNSISATKETQQEERTKLTSLQNTYKLSQDAYAKKVSVLNAEGAAYLEKVQKANTSGGAPTDLFIQLQKEKESLLKKQNFLKEEHVALQKQSDEISKKIASFNQGVRQVNTVVQNFNTLSYGDDFEEGLYTQDANGKRISIYAYKNKDELVHSLAHELGHALLLPHNENPASIMFPYNKSGIKLSAEDISDLKKICKM
jgi:Matrixin